MNAAFQSLRSNWDKHFGSPPTLFARAPGRVNLIGEHTDYNDGFVFPAAISMEIQGLFRKAHGTSRLISEQLGEAAPFVIGRKAERTWAKHASACAMALADLGLNPPPIEGFISSTLPGASGLSSSAALELCLLSAWNELGSLGLSARELAMAGWNAENKYVGLRCGIMDQMAVALGRAGSAMLLDTRTLEVDFTPIPANLTVVILDTQKPRSLAGSAYNDRVVECASAVRAIQGVRPEVTALRDARLDDLGALSGVGLMRARHVITENARVIAFKLALEAADEAAIGQICAESHQSLRDDYQVSCRELDAMVDVAGAAPGCVGVRLTGAGFGGCCVALARQGAKYEFCEATEAAYLALGLGQPRISPVGTTSGTSVQHF